MKNINLKIVIILLIGLFIVDTGTSFGNQSAFPDKLEIGLFFRASAKSTVVIKTKHGFEINQHRGDNVTKLKTLTETQGLVLRKDAYYLGSGGNYVEYTGPIQEQVGKLKLQGPYHLQLGGIYKDLAKAEAFIDGLQLSEGTPYLAYEEGWRVFYGQFISEAVAEVQQKEVSAVAKVPVTVVLPSDTRVQVMDLQGNPILAYDSRENIYFGPFVDKGTTPLVEVEGSQFRGEITAKRSKTSDMAVVNKLSLEEYLYGVVPREMSASWPLEALKAQAVAARGFAVTMVGKYKDDGFDLCNTVSSQVYGGYDVEEASTNRAVDETASLILTYDGVPITPFYHSNSGGHTENSENIWSDALGYIRGVKDPYSEGAPNATWTKAFTMEEIQETMAKNNINVGEVKNIRITETSSNGRVLTLIVEGNKGEAVLKKEVSRSILGLKSSWFQVMLQGEGVLYAKTEMEEDPASVSTNELYVISANGTKEAKNPSDIKVYNGESYRGIESNPEAFVFEGKGYGHGLGMSQHGAKVMAEKNFSFEEILTHYFTGVKVELR